MTEQIEPVEAIEPEPAPFSGDTTVVVTSEGVVNVFAADGTVVSSTPPGGRNYPPSNPSRPTPPAETE